VPKRITNIKIPDSVPGGEEFSVTVEYTADQDGDLKIVYRGTCDGHPGIESLAVTSGTKTFAMTVVRYGATHQCRIDFQFGNAWPVFLEVT
jgi:hypothetical protein